MVMTHMGKLESCVVSLNYVQIAGSVIRFFRLDLISSVDDEVTGFNLFHYLPHRQQIE